MGEIGERLVEVGLRADDDHFRVVGLAADFADSVEWAAAGFSSPGRWIAVRLDVARRTANDWIRVGRALRSLPVISAALEAHLVSFAKAKELTRTATADTEAELVELAGRVPAADLPAAVAAWSQRFEPDEVIDERHQAGRGLSWRIEPDGTVVGTVRGPPVEAGVAMAAIDADVMRTGRARRGDREGSWPSLAQQRFDALMGLLAGGGARVATEVVIHVRGDGVSLDDGTPLTASAVAALLPESLIRTLVHDADGRPINASSRHRHPTVRQQRVVKERDRVCTDCGEHDLLQYDHVPDFETSKRTIVDELQLRCSTCHRFRHREPTGTTSDRRREACGDSAVVLGA